MASDQAFICFKVCSKNYFKLIILSSGLKFEEGCNVTTNKIIVKADNCCWSYYNLIIFIQPSLEC